jgi:hypothetical protein
MPSSADAAEEIKHAAPKMAEKTKCLKFMPAIFIMNIQLNLALL